MAAGETITEDELLARLRLVIGEEPALSRRKR
jgi:hypothetical protein